MTDYAGHSPPRPALDEALHARATEAADVSRVGDATQSRRLGSWLRAGTFAVDGTAVVCALLWLDAIPAAPRPYALPPLAFAWLVLLRAWGAYRRGIGYRLTSELKTMFLSGFSGALLLLQLGPWLGLHVHATTGSAIGVPVAMLAAGRLALRGASAALRKQRALVRRVLLVGDGPDAYELLENIEAWPGLGVEIVGVCADTTKPSVRGLPVLGLSRSCNLVARDLGVRTVVLAPASLEPHACSKIHSDLLDSELEVILAPNVAQVDSGRLSARQFGGLPVLRLEQREQRLRMAGKRAFDLVAATLLIIAVTPIFLALSALIRLDSRGPAYFRQRRVGRDGVPFELWKFRTMRVDAESLLD